METDTGIEAVTRNRPALSEYHRRAMCVLGAGSAAPSGCGNRYATRAARAKVDPPAVNPWLLNGGFDLALKLQLGNLPIHGRNSDKVVKEGAFQG